tara:strand:+ start:1679 stop:1885 length:207 start_codon:yes stop_codon:yes gene_type:complete
MKILNMIFEHLSSWGLVWFGLLFWGSIINAGLLIIFNDASTLLIDALSYFLGLSFGLLAKSRGWSWIN